jgi:hypothetical protein
MSIMNLNVAFECIEACINSGLSTYLAGPIGVGKTSGYKQLAARMGGGFIYLNPLIMDPVDLKGMPYYDEAKSSTVWLKPSFLPQLERDGANGIILIDEFSKASPAMKNACFEMILEHRSGEHPLLPGWVVCAAGNRAVDKSGDTRLPLALANKFAHFEVRVDNATWHDWAVNNVKPVVQAFIRFRPELLHAMPKGDSLAFPTPRAWEFVSSMLDQSNNATRIHLVSSLVGEGAAAEFEGFYRVHINLPTPDEIFASPTTARVPAANEPAACYAVSAMLGRMADKSNADAAFTYSARLPKEFDVLAGHDARKRTPTIAKTKAFGQWAARNQKVML